MTRTMDSLSRDRQRHSARGEASGDRSMARSPRKQDKEKDFGPPGAGAVLVYGHLEREASRSPRRKRLSKDREKRSSKALSLNWEDVSKYPYEPCRAKSPDRLLEAGIDAYTFIPAHQGGILGRGKFSTVYRVTDVDGTNFALKHTPLHPHHPLIAARLLREPTLLASLPTHPCLIGVHGSIRTQGHFYLIEQYATSHVPLSAHPSPLRPSRAAYILDQLMSVVRDCLHSGGRVVHRDLKAENILIDVDSGDLLLLDLGLGTHFSASEPKLTTCCGSPAFHSPEVVNALNHPPGEVSYYGPELDIWCIALTLLSILLDIRFPIGPSHKSLHVMRDRVLDRLQELDQHYPANAPWIKICRTEELSKSEREFEIEEWKRVRKALRDFLDINGNRRMAAFAAHAIGQHVVDRVEDHARESGLATGFKETSFIPCAIKHTLPLYLEADTEDGSIVLSNPTGLSERKIVSYLKYILRSRGVLYHCIGTNPRFLDASYKLDSSPATVQLVLPYPSPMHDRVDGQDRSDKRDSWVSSLFNGPKRAASVPPQVIRQRSASTDGERTENAGWYLKCWARVEIEKPVRSTGSRTSSRRGSNEALSPITTTPPVLPLSPIPAISTLSTLEEGVTPDCPTPRARSVEPRSRAAMPSMGSRTSSTSRIPRPPHPLSRQVSTESRASARSQASKVVVTLSDPRGYGVLRKVLDVKHLPSIDSPISSNSNTLVAASERSEETVAEGPDQKGDMEEETERGRPRSKEDAKVIVQAHVAQSDPQRGVSRGRKIGFLEGWFGLGGADDEPARSASMPPAMKVPSPVQREGRFARV